MRHDELFRSALPVPERLFNEPLFATHVGWEIAEKNQPYPLPQAPFFDFNSREGRVLPGYSLVWIEEGSGTFETKTWKRRVGPGSVIFYKSNEWHRHAPEVEEGWVIYWVHFDGIAAHRWEDRALLDLDDGLLKVADPELFKAQFERLIRSAKELRHSNGRTLSYQVMGLMSHCLKQEANPINEQLAKDQLTRRAVQHIWNHTVGGMTVDEVATHLGCGRRTLERHFMATMRYSVGDEIQRCQLTRVKWLLEETEIPFHEVASRASMKNYRQLLSLLKKHTGMTPKQYRSKVREDGKILE